MSDAPADAPTLGGPDGRSEISAAALFWFLTRASLGNRVRVQLRRMRTPRYVLPLLVGLVYVWYFVFRPRSGGGAAAGALLGSGVAATAAGLGLLALAVNWWAFGGDRAALAFSPAEVDLLFPAPLTRKQLVHFKLLRAQALILVNVVVWLLITRRGSPDVPLPLRAVAFWALISTMQLHRLAASMVRASAVEHGASGARRNWPALGLLAAVGAALVAGVAEHWPLFAAASGPAALGRALGAAFSEGPAHWALLPARLVLAPTFAADAGAWRAAILPSLGIVALHYLWVVRTDAAFEEAAVEATARHAALVAARRARASGRFVPSSSGGGEPATGARRLPFARRAGVPKPWFRLRPAGPPAGAITWKNVVAMTRTTRPATVIVPLLVAAGVFAASATGGGHAVNLVRVAAFMLFAASGMLVVAGPHYVRNDLRLDMPRLSLLRAYPLRGRDVVAAEIAAPLAVLTGIQLCGLALSAIAAFSAHLVDRSDLANAAVWVTVLAGLVALPALNAAGIAVQNAAALLFPSWMRLGSARAPGVEALGQNLLAMLVTYLLLALALLLPVTIGAGAYAAVDRDAMLAVLEHHVPSPAPAALVTATGAALAALWGEVWLAILWLGRVFDRTEPGAEQ